MTDQKMQSYILGAKAREQQRQVNLQQLQNRDIEVAKQAAVILRQDFGVTRVVLFGSMLNAQIHENSDIDIAAWNLPESLYFQAVGKLQGLSEFSIDLIESENATSYMAEAIAQGIDL